MTAGKNEKEKQGNGIALDFTGLFHTENNVKQAQNEAPEGAGEKGKENAYKNNENPAKPQFESQTAEQSEQLHLEAVKIIDIYRKYQQNTMKSTQLQAEILKGLSAGESTDTLLLKAAEAISLMTDNKHFFTQIKEDMEIVSGSLEANPAPPKEQIKALRERLDNLRQAQEREQRADRKGNIKRIIQAHEDRIRELETLPNKGI